MKILRDNMKIDEKSVLLFFAAAFAAIISLSIIIYMDIEPSRKFKERAVSIRRPHMAVESAENSSPSPRIEPVRKIQSPREIIKERIDGNLPVARAKMDIPGAQILQGKWIMRNGESTIATFLIQGDRYKIIYTNDPQGRQRQFSIGTFSYKESSGQLTLYPSQDEQPDPIKGVTYTNMTPRVFDMFVTQQAGAQDLYLIPPSYAIAARAIHPLFLYVGYDDVPVLKFSPMKTKKPSAPSKEGN